MMTTPEPVIVHVANDEATRTMGTQLLRALAAVRPERASIATAYLTPDGFLTLKDGLQATASVRLLLGERPFLMRRGPEETLGPAAGAEDELFGPNEAIDWYRFLEGDYVAVMGPSGSGKSTFLNLLGCLDKPTTGRYLLGGEDVSTMSDDELSEIRRTRIGFIFQSFNLISELSVVENIEVPLFYQGVSEAESRERSSFLAGQVGLGHRLGHHPSELSGGERQRVAIARALANDPLVILADEPTGNLDSKSGSEILAVLDDLHREGKTIIMVTHDENVAERTEAIVSFRDGEIVSDGTRAGAAA